MKQILYSLLCVSFLMGSCSMPTTSEENKEEITNLLEEDQQQEFRHKVPTLPAKEEVATEETSPKESTQGEIEYTRQTSPRTLCQGKAKEVAAQRLNLSSLAPAQQVFTIDPTKDNHLTTAEGVEFFIPKNSFDESEPTIFKLTEFFGKTAVYTQKLTTETTSGGLLESAGMFDLIAEVDGNPVELKQGAEIIVKMPEAVPAGMNVYYGEENENGDVVWEKDELGTELTPVVLFKKGFHKLKAASFIENKYKFDKATMLELVNDHWTTRASFDTEGHVIGYTRCNDSAKARSVACHAFFDLLENSDPAIFKYHMQKSDVVFNFECISKKEHIARQTRGETEDVFANAFKDFEPAMNGKPRKHFSIGALGPINIDKDIPLPEAKNLRPLLVKVENSQEEIKLLFKKKNTVVSAVQRDGFYVFNRMPCGAEVVVVSTYAKGDQAYVANKSYVIDDSDNLLTLNYEAVKTDDLAMKLAEICQ